MPRRARRYIGSRVTSWPSRVTCAGIGRHQAGDHVEHRGLAGAVGAQQAHRLAPAGGQAHALDDHAAAVGLLARWRPSASLAAVDRIERLGPPGLGRCRAGARVRPGGPPAALPSWPGTGTAHCRQSLRSTGLALVLGSQPIVLAWRQRRARTFLIALLGLLLRILRVEQQALLAGRTLAPGRRLGAELRGIGRREGGRGLVAGATGAAAASNSSSNRYMPVVRSILSRGPSATSLPRETTTWSPIRTVLALTSKIRPVAGRGLAVLGDDQHLLPRLHRVIWEGALPAASSPPLVSPKPDWPV